MERWIEIGKLRLAFLSFWFFNSLLRPFFDSHLLFSALIYCFSSKIVHLPLSNSPYPSLSLLPHLFPPSRSTFLYPLQSHLCRYVPKKYESWEQKKAHLQEEMSGLKHYTTDDERQLLNKSKERRPHPGEPIEPIDESNSCDENFGISSLFMVTMVFFFISCSRTVLQEIEERIEWLNEMDKLGEGHKYRQMIQNEIAERLRLIKQLDREDSALDQCQGSQ